VKSQYIMSQFRFSQGSVSAHARWSG